jgi:hypothetical protein
LREDRIAFGAVHGAGIAGLLLDEKVSLTHLGSGAISERHYAVGGRGQHHEYDQADKPDPSPANLGLPAALTSPELLLAGCWHSAYSSTVSSKRIE